MRERVVAAIESIAAAVRVVAEDAYTVGGRPGRLVPPAEETALAAPVSASPLVAGLLQTVYQGWYCGQGQGQSFSQNQGFVPAEGGYDLLAALQAANAGRERWDGGWRVAAMEADGSVAVRKGSEARVARPGEYVGQGPPGMPPIPGGEVTLRAPREAADYQPGFYFAFGETLGAGEEAAPWVRLYWHLRAAAAPALVAGLTGRLNRYQVPFRLKVLRRSEHYRRPDAGVLYVHRRHYQVAGRLGAEVHAELAALPGGGLRAEAPLFAKPLAPGLAVAEDPGHGESFGWERSRRVAEALVAVDRRGVAAEERPAAVARHLEAAGLDLDRPHLCRSRADLYDVPAPLGRFPHAA